MICSYICLVVWWFDESFYVCDNKLFRVEIGDVIFVER